MTTGAFSRGVGGLFSELWLVTDNLLLQMILATQPFQPLGDVVTKLMGSSNESNIAFNRANFHIPKAGPVFEEVIYTEIYGPASEKIVRQYREDALGLPSYPSQKRGRYEGGGGRDGRYGPPPSRGYSPYRPYYNPYSGYGRPSYPPYGPPPPPPPPMYGPPHHRGGYRPRSPYGGRQYGYGPPPPQYPRGGYYGRY